MINVIICRDQSGAETQCVVISGQRPVCRSDHNTLGHTVCYNSLNHFFCRRFFCPAILHKFSTAEKSSSAHISDNAVFISQSIEIFEHTCTHGARILQEIFVLDDAHIFNCSCWTGCASTKCGNITEIVHRVRSIIFEHFKDVFRCYKASNRRITRSYALSHRHHIWLYVKILIAKPSSCSAHTANHFVDM